MEFTGKLVAIKEVENITETFSKRCFHLEVVSSYEKNGEQQLYSNTYNMELQGKAISYIDNFNIGDTVTVLFNIKGRPWKDTCFNTLVAYSIKSNAVIMDNNYDYEENSGLPF